MPGPCVGASSLRISKANPDSIQSSRLGVWIGMTYPLYAVVEAPSVLGLFPRGVETLPEALLGAGLVERIGARRAGRIEPPPYNPQRDRATNLLNPSGIADYSRALADRVEHLRSRGMFPIVLGGDCSILLGCVLATRAMAARASCSWTVMPTSISPMPSQPARPRRWTWRWRPGAGLISSPTWKG